MGSTHSLANDVHSGSDTSTNRFEAIRDQYASLDGVKRALRSEGLEFCNLIVAVDFTASNEWTGKHSFSGRSLHHLCTQLNPYEWAIKIIGNTLAAFDEDQLIPAYGFGDASCQDTQVFSFNPLNEPCQGLDRVLRRYRQLVPSVKLAGPTSFAPAIRQACKTVNDSGGQFHILLLIADGQVTRSVNLQPGQLSPQEAATVEALVEASQLPLSVVMVGVGDGPWEQMREFDDALPQRNFDNFQFVNFTEVMAEHGADTSRGEAQFALQALMEVPAQYKIIKRLRLLGHHAQLQQQCLPPLDPPTPAAAAAAGYTQPRHRQQHQQQQQQLNPYPAVHIPVLQRSAPGWEWELPAQLPAQLPAHSLPQAHPASSGWEAQEVMLAAAAADVFEESSVPAAPRAPTPLAHWSSYPDASAGWEAQASAAAVEAAVAAEGIAQRAVPPAAPRASPAVVIPQQRAAPAAAAAAAADPLENPLFLCPITHDVMEWPVVAADGFTYERQEIEEWLSTHNTSPVTNAALEHKQLVPNHALRSAIKEAQQAAARGSS
ncbi:hypothetical protein OEZ85_009131 [Tetradesmus obliquus]|uniref:U-box domain-containing protein n=1 Tax=Tetradesmus obliquus TaxID=3088 RepID=A0ABY8TMX5_TETOB|nr:hypothetical protein OEZ85_009131 [Tetradesmus obliquus]